MTVDSKDSDGECKSLKCRVCDSTIDRSKIMRWFRWLFVPLFVVLPISIAIWGQNWPSWISPVLVVLLIFSGAAFVLRSRLMAWTVVGGFVGSQLCGRSEFNEVFGSPAHLEIEVFLFCVGSGSALGLVHDAFFEERQKRRLRKVFAPHGPTVPMSLELLWNDNYVGTVTKVESINPAWCAGRFIPDPQLSEDLRQALRWMTAQSRSEVDLADPPAEPLREGWRLLERSGRMIRVRPLVDWTDLSIVWEHPDFHHGESRVVGADMADSSRHPSAAS